MIPIDTPIGTPVTVKSDDGAMLDTCTVDMPVPMGTFHAVHVAAPGGMELYELEKVWPIAKLNLRVFQAEQKEWAERNFGPLVGYQMLLGVMEEVGELAHAHLKKEQSIRVNEDHDAAKIDAVGDAVIFLAAYCSAAGIDLEDAIARTWKTVSARDWTKNKETGAAPASTLPASAEDMEEVPF